MITDTIIHFISNTLTLPTFSWICGALTYRLFVNEQVVIGKRIIKRLRAPSSPMAVIVSKPSRGTFNFAKELEVSE